MALPWVGHPGARSFQSVLGRVGGERGLCQPAACGHSPAERPSTSPARRLPAAALLLPSGCGGSSRICTFGHPPNPEVGKLGVRGASAAMKWWPAEQPPLASRLPAAAALPPQSARLPLGCCSHRGAAPFRLPVAHLPWVCQQGLQPGTALETSRGQGGPRRPTLPRPPSSSGPGVTQPACLQQQCRLRPWGPAALPAFASLVIHPCRRLESWVWSLAASPAMKRWPAEQPPLARRLPVAAALPPQPARLPLGCCSHRGTAPFRLPVAHLPWVRQQGLRPGIRLETS